ncbi:hypothetical protein [Xanthomonas translucens]|uniref:hypothetical protein n=1 Tax=Xanthomonas campestris pv. translucens TaxID=343 RepID=UPI0012D7A6E9|nr:hypothetical protein [Xanthomonas translucens]
MLMTIAFLPFAALAAAYIASTLKPAKRRPLISIAGGSFISVLGALGGYALRPALQSGYVRFNSRYAGDIHAVLAQNPLRYWAIVFVLYAMFVLLAGFGFAMIGLCFRKGAAIHADLTKGARGNTRLKQILPHAPDIEQDAACQAGQDTPPGMHSMALQRCRAHSKRAGVAGSIGGECCGAGGDAAARGQPRRCTRMRVHRAIRRVARPFRL